MQLLSQTPIYAGLSLYLVHIQCVKQEVFYTKHCFYILHTSDAYG